MILSRREANKARCRKEILKASRRLFKEKGYENTMIEEVAEKAGISKATLYNYFPNKDSLLMGTLDEVTDGFEGFINNGFDEDDNGYEKIRKSMVFLIQDSIPFLSVSRRILWLNANSESVMYGKTADVNDQFDKLIENAKTEGLLRDDLSNGEIRDILMGVYLLSQFQWRDLEQMTMEQVDERVSRTLELMLAGCLK